MYQREGLANCKTLEHGGKMVCAGVPVFAGFWSEDGHVEKNWLLL